MRFRPGQAPACPLPQLACQGRVHTTALRALALGPVQKALLRMARALAMVPLFIGFFASVSSNTNQTVHQVCAGRSTPATHRSRHAAAAAVTSLTG